MPTTHTQIRSWLSNHGQQSLATLRRAYMAQHHNLPLTITRRLLARLDSIAQQLGTRHLSKADSPLAHRADLDTLHAMHTCARHLNLPDLQATLAELIHN